MTRFLRALAASAAACLFVASGAALSAAAPVTDQLLAPLTAAYARAVAPGEQADLHRDLFWTVIQRVQRNYALEVDVPQLVATASKAIESLEPQSADPAEAFKEAILRMGFMQTHDVTCLLSSRPPARA